MPKNDEIKQNGKNIIEKFTPVGGGGDGSNAMGGLSNVSFTKTAFCSGATSGGKSSSLSGGGLKDKKVGLVPNKDQMSSDYSKFNPIWLIFPVINLIIDILKMVWEVWLFIFKIVFFKTYEVMLPKEFNFGFKPGKKYCSNLMPFRMLITFLCPPAGVFMAYGIGGFVQIIICMILSLFFYVPGLIYGLIVILRSDIGEYLEQVELDVCADDGSTAFFSSDEEKPKCSAMLGDVCTIKGVPKGNDPMELNCCIQPKYVKKIIDGVDNGQWELGDTGVQATGPDGNQITQFAEGELRCANDFYTKAGPSKGMCVYKATGSTSNINSLS
jgi:uncharacterized membrane protein YqaE (UPF0057 family)